MEHLKSVSALADPLRAALYDFVVSSSGAVSRDQAADEVGVPRQTAAYHLDRLVESGVLDVEYRRLTAKQGPGAGRPAKLYKRSGAEYSVTIPPRRYQVAARVLLNLASSPEVDSTLLRQAAHEVGADMVSGSLVASLRSAGYEPTTEDGETRFRNCPFYELKERDRDTTCSMSQALVGGMIAAAGCEEDTSAFLEPEEGYCCVRLRPPVGP